MRTRYWSRELMFAAGFGRPDQFIEECGKPSSRLASLAALKWQDYFHGQTTPLNKTVDLVESVISGSAKNFYEGPEGLPLWAVLSGDVKKSKGVFYDFTDEAFQQEDWDFHQRVVGLLTLFLPKSFETLQVRPEGFPELSALPSAPRRYQTWLERYLKTQDGRRLLRESYEEKQGVELKHVLVLCAAVNLARANDNSYAFAITRHLLGCFVDYGLENDIEVVGSDLSRFLVQEFLRH